MNCVISNVPGPQIPLYAASARLIDMYGFGPLVDGLALFIPVLSYCGGITIGVTSCREIMPDPERFMLCIEESFEELKAGVSA